MHNVKIDLHNLAQACTDLHSLAQACTDLHKLAQTCAYRLCSLGVYFNTIPLYGLFSEYDKFGCFLEDKSNLLKFL